MIATTRCKGGREQVREYLIEAREKAGLTQQDVANRIGISRQYYQMVETGERQKRMDLSLAGGLSVVLNIPIAEIKGIAMDGMPHGSTPGDSTASLAVKLADDVECQRRENELRVRQDVLRADQTTIRGQLDRLNSRYKTILCGRYVYSDPSLQKGWKTIARELRKTEITAQRWEKFALVVLGSMLDEVPMVEELLSRAYDARD